MMPYGSQKTTFRSGFSTSTTGALGSNFGCQAWWQGPVGLNHPTPTLLQGLLSQVDPELSIQPRRSLSTGITRRLPPCPACDKF